jgi:hypothetical protein
MRKLKEEAIRLYDTGDTRSFAQIYAGREDLFEDVDEIISPKMKALFESVYGETHNKLKEEIGGDASDNPNHNFSGDEGKPSGDGVCDGHNKAGISGSDPCVNQSGQDYSSNPKLFDESMKEIYEKAQLKESFEDEDDFDFDAVEDEEEVNIDDLDDEGEIDPLDADNLDDFEDEDFFEDYDDGTSLEDSYEYEDYSSDDEFDLE